MTSKGCGGTQSGWNYRRTEFKVPASKLLKNDPVPQHIRFIVIPGTVFSRSNIRNMDSEYLE